jgi:hypothetical protein
LIFLLMASCRGWETQLYSPLSTIHVVLAKYTCLEKVIHMWENVHLIFFEKNMTTLSWKWGGEDSLVYERSV